MGAGGTGLYARPVRGGKFPVRGGEICVAERNRLESRGPVQESAERDRIAGRGKRGNQPEIILLPGADQVDRGRPGRSVGMGMIATDECVAACARRFQRREMIFGM